MPGYNRTGPMGNGPMTGRGMGSCTGIRYNRAFCGRGMGRSANLGAGFGRGRSLGFNQNINYDVKPITPEEEKEVLNDQKEFLKSQLSDIDKQLEEL
jgi:hypothetical protein